MSKRRLAYPFSSTPTSCSLLSDLFGSKAFAVVQNDLTGNITASFSCSLLRMGFYIVVGTDIKINNSTENSHSLWCLSREIQDVRMHGGERKRWKKERWHPSFALAHPVYISYFIFLNCNTISQDGKTDYKNSAVHSGLHFTYEGLRLSQKNPGEELSESFTKGYETTLKPHHSFVVKPLFAVST
jgi:hypothetical protein